MTRNDRHTVRALFLLGANDGVLPAAEQPRRRAAATRTARRSRAQQRAASRRYGMEQFHLEMQNLYAALAQPTDRLYGVLSALRMEHGRGEARHRSSSGASQTSAARRSSVETESADKEYRLSAKSSGALEYAGEHIGGAAVAVILKRQRRLRSVRLPR